MGISTAQRILTSAKDKDDSVTGLVIGIIAGTLVGIILTITLFILAILIYRRCVSKSVKEEQPAKKKVVAVKAPTPKAAPTPIPVTVRVVQELEHKSKSMEIPDKTLSVLPKTDVKTQSKQQTPAPKEDNVVVPPSKPPRTPVKPKKTSLRNSKHRKKKMVTELTNDIQTKDFDLPEAKVVSREKVSRSVEQKGPSTEEKIPPLPTSNEEIQPTQPDSN